MLNGKWIRKGSYKAVFVTKPYGPEKWQLFNIEADPGETNDLSTEKPDLLEELKAEWIKYSDEVSIVEWIN